MNESSRQDEARLERELGEILHGREPGPTPYGLRGRVERIADEVPAGRAPRGLRRALRLLAAAAALAVLVAGARLLA